MVQLIVIIRAKHLSLLFLAFWKRIDPEHMREKMRNFHILMNFLFLFFFILRAQIIFKMLQQKSARHSGNMHFMIGISYRYAQWNKTAHKFIYNFGWAGRKKFNFNLCKNKVQFFYLKEMLLWNLPDTMNSKFFCKMKIML